MKRIIIFLLILNSTFTKGSKLTSNGTGGGDWTQFTSWSSLYTTCVDSIIILENDTININGHLDLESCSSIYLEINGVLNFPNNGDKLQLPEGSRIEGPSANSIIDAPGHDASNKISIAGYGWVFTSNGNSPDLQGPFSYGNLVLPITLSSFTVEKANSGLLIEWTTSAEINNDYFTIYKSIDGSNWNSISTVNGSGNSTIEKSYTFLDETPQKVNYYKLQQTDFNGSNSFSHIISYKHSAYHKLEIYPNPLKKGNSLSIEFSENELSVNSIYIVDFRGQKNTLVYHSGGSTIKATLPEFMSPGMYTVEVQFTDGTTTRNKILVN